LLLLVLLLPVLQTYCESAAAAVGTVAAAAAATVAAAVAATVAAAAAATVAAAAAASVSSRLLPVHILGEGRASAGDLPPTTAQQQQQHITAGFSASRELTIALHCDGTHLTGRATLSCLYLCAQDSCQCRQEQQCYNLAATTTSCQHQVMKDTLLCCSHHTTVQLLR
jgi:hypothetical protein